MAGIGEMLCQLKGSVKYTSLESGQSSWRTGSLALAAMPTGQVLCLVNFKIGLAKKFVLTNQIKGVIFNHQVPRCVVSLTTGTNISWTGKSADRQLLNSPGEVNLFSHTLESLKSGRKRDGRPDTSAQFGLHMSPQPMTPVMQSPAQRRYLPSRELVATPRSQVAGHGSGRASPNPMTTPSHLRAATAAEVIDVLEDSGTGSDEAATELSPLLFTDLQSDMEKENFGPRKGPSLSARTPKTKGSAFSKSVYDMRKEEGGSLFMSSFQEKQQQLEERKENMAPRPSSGIKSFYSRGQQASGYAAGDAFLPSRQGNSQKRTPGFLSLSQPKRVCVSPRYAGWNQRSLAPPAKSSQMDLQGFSNLGNTCYMNAILQSLFALENFTMDILNGDLSHMQEDSLYKALASLLFGKQRNQSADRIGKQLRRVKQAISTTTACFSGFMQHDAQEFLCQCLDQLKEDWGKAQRRGAGPVATTPGGDHARGAAPGDQARGVSEPAGRCPVVVNFEFEVLHTIRCDRCGTVVTKTEQFYDLSLDMPRRSTSNPIGSIQTALDQFFQVESLEYACSECSCKQATVTHTFTRLPRVIIVHLKRYRFDADAAFNAKLRRRILIPRYLTLHRHCGKETDRPAASLSSPAPAASLPCPAPIAIPRTASPLRSRNGEAPLRTALTDVVVRNTAVTGQLGRPAHPSTRKKLEYLDGDASHPDGERAPLSPGSLVSRKEDETQRALAISKREAERVSLEVTQRQQQEEEELRRAMEESKQDADRSLPQMTEEEQLAYALAISRQDTPAARPPRSATILTPRAPSPAGLAALGADARQPDAATDDGAGSLKRRSGDAGGRPEGAAEEGLWLGTDGGQEAATPWKRFRSDGGLSNHSTPSHAGDSGIDLMDDSRNSDGRTLTSAGRGVRLSTEAEFARSPPDVAVPPPAGGLPTAPGSPPRSALGESAAIDAHGASGPTTPSAGEAGDKPSYEELKALEDEELRRATELSLQDAQEMAQKEEDALKRAKEISLQEFSESWQDARDEDEAAEPMEEGDETDEEVLKELNKNAECGHLPSSYRLVSVVSHIGSSSAVGHYISDVCDGQKSSAWLSYDDSEVVRISESAVRESRERTGYIFFYAAP